MERPLRVLWTSNIPLYPIQRLHGLRKGVGSGSWMNGLLTSMRQADFCKIAIVSTSPVGNTKTDLSLDVIDGNLDYYHFQKPRYKYPYTCKPSKHLLNKYAMNLFRAIEEFAPDIIHIHGTEEPWGLIKQIHKINIPLIISIQGINLLCSKKAWGDMTLCDVAKIQKITPRSVYRLFPTLWKRRALRLRAKLEVPMLQSADCIIGRTLWDHAFAKGIAPDIPYRIQNEILRKEFYDQVWKMENIDRNTIYASGRCTLAKGVHTLLKAIRILVKEFPNIKLNYAGAYNFHDSEFRYMRKLVKEYKIENNVEFCGHLNPDKLISLMLRSHSFVSPSFVENSPNSLQEAQYIGMPCVTTNAGGITTIAEDRISALMCEPGNEYMIAMQIGRILSDDSLAIRLSQKARSKAIERNDPERIVEQLQRIYLEYTRAKQ